MTPTLALWAILAVAAIEPAPASSTEQVIAASAGAATTPATCTLPRSHVRGHGPGPVATFSIAAADPKTHQVGVAVASRFFAVGSVVPWASADAGAIATQAFANTSFGPFGMALLQGGRDPSGVLEDLLAGDDQPERRQVGIVAADGRSVSHTGSGCTPWAGHRTGQGYAIQGNILAGEEVVIAMERAFLDTPGSLAQRLYAALDAGEEAGGDSRGRQSAALMVARRGAGYGGYTDRYIDIRVDDHPDPLMELDRLLEIAEVNGLWNMAWTAYTQGRMADAEPWMERTAAAGRAAASDVLPEILYDLAIVRAQAGHTESALDVLEEAIEANPGLATGARDDEDLAPLRTLPGFRVLVKRSPEPSEDDLLCRPDDGEDEGKGDPVSEEGQGAEAPATRS
jgi:uncharacterized Ntn-hydrolase superfamily protein